ncbi:nuclear transport factor 2 family protein [Streptomyces sp. NPDC004096]
MQYALAVDFGDAAALAGCFTPDGAFCQKGLPDEAGGHGRFEGRESIEAFGRDLFRRTRGHVRHWTSHPLIETVRRRPASHT